MNFEFNLLKDGAFEFKNTERGKSVSLRFYPREYRHEHTRCVYILLDANKYCCYVGQTDDLAERFSRHKNDLSKFWWMNAIVFSDGATPSAFKSGDDRLWYEKQLFDKLKVRLPTFTEKASANPDRPRDADKVLGEILDLLDLVGIHLRTKPLAHGVSNPRQDELPLGETGDSAGSEPSRSSGEKPDIGDNLPKKDNKPRPAKPKEPANHPPHDIDYGAWNSHGGRTALAAAFAREIGSGSKGTASGFEMLLRNAWLPSGNRGKGDWASVSDKKGRRKAFEDYGVEFFKFNGKWRVKSCASVPYPLQKVR